MGVVISRDEQIIADVSAELHTQYVLCKSAKDLMSDDDLILVYGDGHVWTMKKSEIYDPFPEEKTQ